jgi:hypothetical protein
MLRQRLRPGDEDGDPEDPEEGKTKKSSAGNKKGMYYRVKIFIVMISASASCLGYPGMNLSLATNCSEAFHHFPQSFVSKCLKVPESRP